MILVPDMHHSAICKIYRSPKVKIDKLFIHSLVTHPKTQQLVEGMIRFGKSMGLYVVAEGVETKEQFELLEKNGRQMLFKAITLACLTTADTITFQ